MSGFLSSPEGREFLLREYVENERPAEEIAADRGVSESTVLRALKAHGIRTRTKSEAQAAALRRGRTTHPTAGRERTSREKKNISQGRKRGDDERERIDAAGEASLGDFGAWWWGTVRADDERGRPGGGGAGGAGAGDDGPGVV